MNKTLGIIGAGKVGIVLAQLAVKAGYNVLIAGSGDPAKIALSLEVLVPGAVATTSQEVALKSDVIILAIPLGRYRELPREELSGKVVIDAMNYWWEVDGDRPDLQTSSSETVQKFLNESHVVKAFSHIGYHDLHDDARPAGTPSRKGVAIAGDRKEDVKQVAGIINDLGFDPVYIGPLSEGIKLEPGGVVFGVHVPAEKLRQLLI